MDRSGAEALLPADPPAIGPYRLLGRLGQGGMGTVYLAEAPTGRHVAVKVVKAEFTVDEGFAARFHSEVVNARRVASFCTAEVLDNGNADDGRPYMVTEYIAGTPLSRQISKYGALEAGTLHGVALGVAAALAAIHVAGLVHRDLKPANVILSMSGPRVIDFGIARALDATQGVTRSGELLGSPGWWAPEQVRGEEITPAADVFSWGCLVAYAGNGRHPYGRGDLITLASRVLAGRPDLGTLPAPLDRLVRQATHPDPRSRPTAQELLIALVGGDPAGAAPRPVGISPPQVPSSASSAVPEEMAAGAMLNESWRPPANLAAAPPATDTPATNSPTAIDGPARPGAPAAGADTPARHGTATRDDAPTRDAGTATGDRIPDAPGAPGLDGGTVAARLTAATGGAPAEHTLVEPAAPGRPTSPAPSSTPGPLPTGTTGSVPGRPVPEGVTAPGPGPMPSPVFEGAAWAASGPPSGTGAAVKTAAGGDDTWPRAGAGQRTVESPLPVAAGAREASRLRKWLVPALTALGGLAVTVAVLVMVMPGRAPVVRTGGTVPSGVASPVRETDVGRRYAADGTLDGAQFVIPAAPRCGLTSYQGAAPREGRFCVVPWTLINPGGVPVALASAAPVLVDDRGAEHAPLPAATPLPGSLAPGGRLDGELVYDLPPIRNPATLKVPISDTTTIEVRL
ncbi:hypothetical protein Sme01_15320 [Sphaerisporangium melleum]|uniref:Protein kinase domain-containing protein n=2 Tax=Sphaerisporangium melleum TaxID=321316 RepID=A0A917VFM2_9ACTN|nr:hypothetical protein GCM10007964_10920 [Sphaerisporangium melleum]GII69056.1 hypothetical protein Sme01_15320 [Sphaerisporangium melleum]